MKVHVHLYGTLRRFSQSQTPGLWSGELPQGANLQDLMKAIGTTEREVAAASIHGKPCSFDTEIPEKAEVILVTNIGGG